MICATYTARSFAVLSRDGGTRRAGPVAAGRAAAGEADVGVGVGVRDGDGLLHDIATKTTVAVAASTMGNPRVIVARPRVGCLPSLTANE